MTDDQKPVDPGKVPPQVIDLEATEIRDEATAHEPLDTGQSPPPGEDGETAPPETKTAEDAEPSAAPADEAPAGPSPPPPPPPRRRAGHAGWIVAALAIGLLAGGWIYRDLLAGYLPTNQMTALGNRVDVLEANGKTAGDQLLAVSQKADDAARAAADATDAIKASAAALADVTGRVDGIAQRVAAAEDALKAARSDLDSLRQALSAGAGTSAGQAPDNAALAALGQRIDALEKDVASLKAGGGDRASLTAGLSQALSDLKAKIAAGTPYAAEYDRIARMVPAAPGLDVLEAHAAEGLPNAQGLAAELTAAIPALPQPEAPAGTSGGGYWDQFLGLLSGIVTVRQIGDTDWPELARKAASLAESGDLAQAISLIEQAEGSKPQALNQWHDRAAARLELEAALAQVSEAVVRQIAALGGGQ